MRFSSQAPRAPGVHHASPPDTNPDVVRHHRDGLIGRAAHQVETLLGG
jgi:hypothetical protein